MRTILLAAIAAIAVSVMPASAKAAATPEADFANYMDLYWARNICPGYEINANRTLEQIHVLGAAFGLSDIEIGTKLSQRAEESAEAYQDDPNGFCRSLTKMFRSYDPEHLLRTGVTEGI